MYRLLLVDDEINISKALRRVLHNTAIAPQLSELTVMMTTHRSRHYAGQRSTRSTSSYRIIGCP